MPDITDAQFAEYSELKVKVPQFITENSKLKETAENTKIALKANREEISELKSGNITLQNDFDTFKIESEEKLKELDGIDQLKENSKNWIDHQTMISEARTAKIDKMKTDLGEDFMKNHKDFLEGLPEDKIETFLTSQFETLNEKSNIETGTTDSGMKPQAGTKHSTKFDEAIGKGNVMDALAEIPAP